MSNILIKDLDSLPGSFDPVTDYIIVERITGGISTTYKLPLSALSSISGEVNASTVFVQSYTKSVSNNSLIASAPIEFIKEGLLDLDSSFVLQLSSALGVFILSKDSGSELISGKSGLIPSYRSSLELFRQEHIGLFGNVEIDKDRGKITISDLKYRKIRTDFGHERPDVQVSGPNITAVIQGNIVPE
jgi:hypothetical protein